MKFGVLGPLMVEADPPVGIGGRQLRRLLAALLVEADRTVPSDRLADVVFVGQPTDAAGTTLRSYVARLRRLLGDDGSGVAIETVPPGFRLTLGSSTLDAQVFEAELAHARRDIADGAPAGAADRLQWALGLWRGSAYAEFADEEWARLEALRLDEMRVSASELRLQALIEAGEHERALPDLRSLAEAHQLREPAWAMWVLALYRSGRQADALRVAERFRGQSGEVGLEPSSEFSALARQVAMHDPSMRRPPPAARRLRGYQIVGELGHGRHGTALLAVQPGVEREVVLRCFAGDIADAPEFIRGFDALVQHVAKLEHLHVVQVQDFWREPGAAYLVTRLLSGGSLTELFAKGPAPVDQVALVVEQISVALASAHRAGLAHGALTEREILFDDEGNAYVDGIGICAALDDIVGLDSGQDALGATESPAARDQYAVAGLVYQALTGFAPFGTTQRVERFPLVSAHRPELLALDGVLARAGAAAPADRYPDLTAFGSSFAGAVGRPAGPLMPARRPTTNPYKGLRAFGEADADDFFGRSRVVDQLLSSIAAGDLRSRFLTVVGASGSGKSSVVRAGLLPRLRHGAVAGSESWYVVAMVPGRSPFDACAEALANVASGPTAAAIDLRSDGIAATVRRVLPAGAVVVLVVDQFEELFTLTTDEVSRRAFIDQLVELGRDPTSSVRVLATLRADFFDRPLADHALGQLVVDGAVPLLGMSPIELEQAIVEPAARVDVTVDPSVAAQIIAEVAGRPGSLPIVQFCLTELFEHRRSDRITLGDYERLGGIGGAVAERAELIFGSLDESQQSATRLLFLRLVTVDGDQPDLRRRTTRSELLSLPGDAAIAGIVLERFGDARLLTFDHDPGSREQTVEVAHETLLRSWPRLREWIRAEGRGLEIRSGLTAAAEAWTAGERDDGDLYRGSRLALAETWADDHPDGLSGSEREYLEASRAARDAERAMEQQRFEQQRASNRRLRRALMGVGVTLVVALVLGVLAWNQRGRARDQAAQAERARGRALAAVAIDQAATDRSLALLLAVEGARLDESVSTRRALLHTLGGGPPPTRTVIPTPAPDYAALAVSGDERVAVGKRVDGSLDVVDLGRRSVRHVALAAPPRIVGGLDVDPEGRFAASAGAASSGVAVTIHDLDTGGLVAEVPGVDGELYDTLFSPDGNVLAVSGPGGRTRLFDVATWTQQRTLDIGIDRLVTAMAFTPDGTSLVQAAFPPDRTALVEPGRLYRLDVDTGDVEVGSAELGADGGASLTVTDDAVYTADELISAHGLADLRRIGEPFGETAGGVYSSLDTSPDGLLAAGGWVTLELFLTTDTGPQSLPDPGDTAAAGLEFLDEGRQLVTADADGTISIWEMGWVDDLGPALEPEGPGNVHKSPDGSTLAVWGLGRGVRLYNRATLAPLGELEMDTELSIGGVDFHPDGGRVVTLTCLFGDPNAPTCPATLTVWDVASGRSLAGPVPAGEVWPGVYQGAAFTGDGEYIVTAGDADGIVLWDADALEPVGEPFALDEVFTMADEVVRVLDTVSVDGRSLVVGGGELGGAGVWDVTGGDVTPLGAFGGNSSVQFTREGQLISASGPGTFRFLDPFTHEQLGTPFVTNLPSLWFDTSDTGLLVASGPWGSQLWDIDTRRPISGVLASTMSALAPDGSTIYLGGWGLAGDASGSDVRALDLRPATLTTLACERAGRNLTADEWAAYMPADQSHRPTCPQWPTVESTSGAGDGN
ncbi:MAG: winged helix-turn-helix domain-containing protein [Actinobacteria bacterium]|nr:winged helix-turn-helix domain-containing protein [Actinomycetota bacterium]